jgi:hypothetical protein
MTIRKPASRRLRQSQSIRPHAAPNTKRSRSTTMKLTSGLQLINEALSRARTRMPQEVGTSEAHRSARQIAIRAQRENARLLGE